MLIKVVKFINKFYDNPLIKKDLSNFFFGLNYKYIYFEYENEYKTFSIEEILKIFKYRYFINENEEINFHNIFTYFDFEIIENFSNNLTKDETIIYVNSLQILFDYLFYVQAK
jgi:hypothetical protein